VAILRWFVALEDTALGREVSVLRARLAQAGFADGGDVLAAGSSSRLPGTARGDAPAAVVVWADRPIHPTVAESLTGLGVPLLLCGPTLERADVEGLLACAAGLDIGSPTGVHDVRVRAAGPPLSGPALLGPRDHASSGSAHLGEHTHVVDRVLRVEKTGDDVEVLLTAKLGLVEHPVLTWRPSSQVAAWTLGSRAEVVAGRVGTRILAMVLRRVTGLPEPARVRVGLLGYGAIGHEHNRAVQHVPGLELAAVCDVSPDRVAAAVRYAPDARGYGSGEELVADEAVDLVIVSTPPSSHAAWALACLNAGKHVIVEKPFAIRTGEADAVLDLARSSGKVAAVYQNRRFDPDHRALRRALDDGLLGDLFHVEAFVGGYGHPCNLWHSDQAVSGGAFYDWGAHVLDQLLDLLPDPIEHVTAVEHKRMWLDVTNADHSRVTVRFTTGAEATFVYSDLAAALKPRWYVLGTRGAVVGHWRTERVVSRSDIGTLAEDVLAPGDSPPLLDLHAADGSVTRMATPAAPPYAFHAELADQVRFGLPPTVTGAQSRRVLAVMEAATASARDGGRPVVPH
jgi:scyllo-inositol 2-dehydrogenase (NADP+)